MDNPLKIKGLVASDCDVGDILISTTVQRFE